MKRRWCTIALAIATSLSAALWVASYFGPVYRYSYRGGPVIWAISGEFAVHNHGSFTREGLTWQKIPFRTIWWPEKGSWWTSWPTGSATGGASYRLNIPLWVPTLAGVLSLAAVRLVPRRRRPGFCPTCGYDIRGLSACPECGSRPTASA